MAAFDPIAAGGIPAGPGGGNTAPMPMAGGNEPVPTAAANPPGFEALVGEQVARQKAMNDRAGVYAADMFPLFKAKQELALAPTGAGQEKNYEAGAVLTSQAPEWLHRAATFATSLGGAFSGIMSREEAAHYAEANKYLTQVSQGVPGATRSNEGAQIAGAASPSVHIPKEAAQAVLQGMLGLRRMEHDQTIQWQQSGLPIQALNGFITRFQTTADPRVYVWDQLTGPQKTQMMSKMSSADQAAFAAKVIQAKSNGIYNTFGMGQ